MQRDRGEGVPDHVMHLAGDPQALLRDDLAVLGRAQLLQLAVALVQRAQDVADGRRQDGDDDRGDHLHAGARLSVQRDRGGGDGRDANVTPAAIAPRRFVRYAADVVANTGPKPLAATA